MHISLTIATKPPRKFHSAIYSSFPPLAEPLNPHGLPLEELKKNQLLNPAIKGHPFSVEDKKVSLGNLVHGDQATIANIGKS